MHYRCRHQPIRRAESGYDRKEAFPLDYGWVECIMVAVTSQSDELKVDMTEKSPSLIIIATKRNF